MKIKIDCMDFDEAISILENAKKDNDLKKELDCLEDGEVIYTPYGQIEN